MFGTTLPRDLGASVLAPVSHSPRQPLGRARRLRPGSLKKPDLVEGRPQVRLIAG